jgi:outer membrane protein OmpA-like peptidoglycan-associated protein
MKTTMKLLTKAAIPFIFFSFLNNRPLSAQTNLLLNGGFEDINTCVEYNAECGVEGWFYLKDVKAQMLSNETNINILGNNSFGIFSSWNGYTGFVPMIGTLLPCGLQQNTTYTFRGMIAAKLNPKLILRAGICTGQRFYVPNRPFAKDMHPESIVQMTPVPNTNFYRFEYSFIATGKERYLTFGTYIQEDTVGAKKKLIGVQTVSLILDNFQLLSENAHETNCPDFIKNKEKIYGYNFRHKEMDYSLFGKGELAISFPEGDSNFITQIKIPPPPPKPDTLKLGDVLFDFNKANLKPGALVILESFFLAKTNTLQTADSILVEGYTDSVGSDKRNLALSQERCESVKQWLLLNGIVQPENVEVRPFGRSRPVASNKTAAGRAMNRRVELVIYRKVSQ